MARVRAATGPGATVGGDGSRGEAWAPGTGAQTNRRQTACRIIRLPACSASQQAVFGVDTRTSWESRGDGAGWEPQMVPQQPFAIARRSRVGCRSRFSNSLSSDNPGQSARTRPPRTTPPSRNAAPPVPWSVPLLPLTRAVRPNSVMTRIAVRSHTSPSWARMAAKPSSSCPRTGSRRRGWSAWVSQPPISKAATRGPWRCQQRAGRGR